MRSLIYRRNKASGALTFVEIVSQGVDGVDGIYGVFWVAISPDGRRLYASSTLGHDLAAFERDPRTGLLILSAEGARNTDTRVLGVRAWGRRESGWADCVRRRRQLELGRCLPGRRARSAAPAE